MKIGISTYCDWKSYGSILQSLALKEFLLNNHIDSFVVSDKLIDNPQHDKIVNLKTFIKFFLNLPFFKFAKKRYQKNINFINKNLLVKRFKSYNALLNNIPPADFYVAGSDQIFHPDLCSPLFFLDFVSDKEKRLTYAASMGSLHINENKKKEFSKLINNFSCISVREFDNIPILKQFNPNSLYYSHVDPTFLVDRSFWEEKQKEYKLFNKKYILVYPIFWDTKLNKQLKKIHRITKMPIVTICNGFSRVYGNKKIYDVGVEEFLWLINNAHYVITSSFHGVAMSIIFKKDFCSVINPQNPSRIRCVLDTFKITPLTFDNICKNMHIDYSNIDDIILYEKNRSDSYFKEMIHDDK